MDRLSKLRFHAVFFLSKKSLLTPVTVARVEKDSVLIVQLNVQAIKFSMRCLFRQTDV